MIGKLIVHGKDRDEAIRKMSRCLDEFLIEGVATTAPLAQAILMDERFRQGNYNTNFLDHFLRDGKLH